MLVTIQMSRVQFGINVSRQYRNHHYNGTTVQTSLFLHTMGFWQCRDIFQHFIESKRLCFLFEYFNISSNPRGYVSSLNNRNTYQEVIVMEYRLFSFSDLLSSVLWLISRNQSCHGWKLGAVDGSIDGAKFSSLTRVFNESCNEKRRLASTGNSILEISHNGISYTDKTTPLYIIGLRSWFTIIGTRSKLCMRRQQTIGHVCHLGPFTNMV